MAGPTDDYKEWMAEDAERMNLLGKAAADLGVQVDTEEGESPDLNEDGSLKDQDTTTTGE